MVSVSGRPLWYWTFLSTISYWVSDVMVSTRGGGGGQGIKWDREWGALM